ncbi:hypothetical protein CF335_g7232 [Tilletia laevis]|nr:hypothetical protein CF335_g7232 [Tilletia laevis]
MQNGVVERTNRTLQDRMRTMLQGAKAPAFFWPLAIAAASYTLNRTPHKAIGYKMPEQKWTGKVADLSLLRVWGCVCWIKVHRSDEGKLRARGVRGMFTGYDQQHKAWLVWTPTNTNKQFHWSRDVVFDETRCFYDVLLSQQTAGAPGAHELTELDWSDVSGVSPVDDAVYVTNELASSSQQHGSAHIEDDVVQARAFPEVERDIDGASSVDLDSLLSLSDVLASRLDMESPPLDPIFSAESPPPPPSDAAAPPADIFLPVIDGPSFVEDAPAEAVNERQLRAERRHIMRFGVSNAAQYFALSTVAYSISTTTELRTSLDGVLLEPANRKEALRRSDWGRWEEAEREQYDALMGMNAWEIVELPKGANIVGSRWVYKLKVDEHGNAARHKARLVAQGFTQRPGEDYTSTFAPVARLDAVRLCFAIAIHLGLIAHSMDVVTAYLNGTLHETIYMRQPPGFHIGNANDVCRLLVPLYGLKQAGHEWNLRLHEVLEQNGFRRCEAERCIYVRRGKGVEFAIILVYVDDLLIFTKTDFSMTAIKAFINKAFKCTDSGPVTHFLGMKIDHDPIKGKVVFSQAAYIDAMLERFGVTKIANAASPLPPLIPSRTPKDTAAQVDRVRSYAQRTGSVKWIAHTVRPDVIFAAGCLGRFQSNPSEEHEALLQQTLRYIRRTKDWTLVYTRSSSSTNPLVGFCDSDYAGDVQTRRSTTGFVYYAFGNPITWTSRLQPTVALSTTEAEYMALCEGMREGLWLRSLYRELGLWHEGPVPLYTDNDGCRSLAHNPDDHRRSKHIDTQYHRTRNAVDHGDLSVSRVDTSENPADVCTKVLPGTKMHDARVRLHLTRDHNHDND